MPEPEILVDARDEFRDTHDPSAAARYLKQALVHWRGGDIGNAPFSSAVYDVIRWLETR